MNISEFGFIRIKDLLDIGIIFWQNPRDFIPAKVLFTYICFSILSEIFSYNQGMYVTSKLKQNVYWIISCLRIRGIFSIFCHKIINNHLCYKGIENSVISVESIIHLDFFCLCLITINMWVHLKQLLKWLECKNTYCSKRN